MAPGLRDLRPNQVGVVQQPFRGRRHGVSQPRRFEQIAPGRLERQFAFAQSREDRALGPVGPDVRDARSGYIFWQRTHGASAGGGAPKGLSRSSRKTKTAGNPTL